MNLMFGTPSLTRQQPEGWMLCMPWIASEQKKPSLKELRSFSKSPEGDIFLLKRTANVPCALAASVKGCGKLRAMPLLRTRTEQSAPEMLPVFGQSVLLVLLISVHFLSLGKAALERGWCSLCVIIPNPDMAITAGHVCETLRTPKS